MTQQFVGRFFETKNLIRAALAALSLTGMAYAEVVSKLDSTDSQTAHPAPVQQGNDYNFTAGGGG